jgi:hypothetical protein
MKAFLINYYWVYKEGDSQYTNIDTIVLIINPVKIVFRRGRRGALLLISFGSYSMSPSLVTIGLSFLNYGKKKKMLVYSEKKRTNLL